MLGAAAARPAVACRLAKTHLRRRVILARLLNIARSVLVAAFYCVAFYNWDTAAGWKLNNAGGVAIAWI